jgi:glycosyltransferase involved in cell wall biosynthesis
MSIEPYLNKFKSQKENQKVNLTNSKQITMILPAYNQEMSIGSLVLLSKLYVSNVIVIDDGCADRTAEIARKAGAEVIIQGEKKGKCEALKTGFKAAVDSGADIIVTMDSDGQHNPVDIPILVAPIVRDNVEMVNGSRYLNGLGKHTSTYRRVGQTLQENVGKEIPDLNITDPQSGFRAFSASTSNIFSFNAKDMTIESEMLADARSAGLRVKEVEIGVLPENETPTKNPIKFVREFSKSIVEDIETNKSLYYSSVPGFALATCGFYMAYKFVGELSGGIQSLNFIPMFLMVFLALSGLCLTFWGIIMHSVVEVIRQTEPAQ